jgi:hypothetical protein
MGTGTDYTPFLSFLGIAAADIAYGGEEEYGQYHSIYDSRASRGRWIGRRGCCDERCPVRLNHFKE